MLSFCCLEYGPIVDVEQETIVGNMPYANNCDYNHGAIIRMGYKGLLFLSKHGDSPFLSKNLLSYI